MSEDFSSMDLDLIDDYLVGAKAAQEALRPDRTELRLLEIEVKQACVHQKVNGNSVAAANKLLFQWRGNDRGVQAIRSDVGKDKSGVVEVSDSLVDGALERVNADTMPDTVEVEPATIVGMPPTSGFIDDPICMANGNFVQQHHDVTTPGFARLIDVERTYNSLMGRRRGVFGGVGRRGST